MKINFSLSLKLTLIVILVSSSLIISTTYVNIQEQSDLFEQAYLEKAMKDESNESNDSLSCTPQKLTHRRVASQN